jgi:DNA-binding LacI/PurR family transcriptional regulator
MVRKKSDRINLADIAARVGVSISTVSRALRGADGHHADTRAGILAVAQEMGYSSKRDVPKRAGRKGNSPYQLLALSQTTSLDIDQRFMAGMSNAAVACNASILWHLAASDQCANVLDPRLAPAALRSGQAHGLVLLHRWPAEVARALARRFPVASIVYDYFGSDIDLINIDDRRGIYELVEHLHAAGHRKIGFFGLCPEVSWSCGRYGAFVESLTRFDLELNPRNVVRIDLPSAISPDEFPSAPWADHVRSCLRDKVDAWICPSALTGQTLCRFFLAEGVRMPDDVSLANFHGDPFASLTDLPRITTASVVDEELGGAAVRRIINHIENPSEARRSILIPARISVGTTTRSAPVATH